MEDISFSSKDGNARLDIAKDTIGLQGKNPIFKICIDKMSDAPEVSQDYIMISDAYDITPAGANFDPGITLTMTFGDLVDGDDTDKLVIAMWDEDAEEWVEIDGCTVTGDEISGDINHYTPFAILLSLEEEAAPAAFTIGNLSVFPAEILPDETVTISAVVTNTGDLAGSYEVVLKINNATEEMTEVTLDGGDSQTVTFTVTRDTVGNYTVSVNNLSGSFTVKEETAVIPPPEPASFIVSNLAILPETVATGVSVIIEVDVMNMGDLDGSYTVELLVNDAMEDTQGVTLSAGETVTVTFAVSRDTAGDYSVKVDGLSGIFTVTQPIAWLLIIEIIAAVLALGIVLYFVRRLLLRSGASSG